MKLNKHQTAIIHIRLSMMDRADVVSILQDRLCMQCYDTETIDRDFAPAIIQAIEAGDLEMDDIPATGGHAEETHQLESDILEDE